VEENQLEAVMDFYSENSDVFELNCPIIEVEPDGSVNTIFL
jgi:hypothetical protein